MKKKILIAHGFWGRGGAEVATMQLIEILKNNFDIHLVTRGGWNLNELNEVAHTSISNTEIKFVKLPFKRLLANTTGGAIWHAIFLRHCRYIASKFDIRITASRTIGWGLPAVHFLSDVVWNCQLNEEYGEKTNQRNIFKKVLSNFGKILAGKGLYGLHNHDVFVANSQWTAIISAPYTTCQPIVIYPPVVANFRDVIWSDRKNEFVSMGRIAPEKKIEDIISIIEQVRALGHEVGLTVFGVFDDSDYAQSIKILTLNKPWIKTPGAIYGEQKSTLLSTFRYGINACTREAFGISTAEMVKVGIIPFVPSQGAQCEIVNNPGLIFNNKQDAVNRIITVLKSESLQQKILQHLQNQALTFSPDLFKQDILKLFESYNIENKLK